MNRLNFNQSVGFPFETNILDEMQKAYTLFNALGYISGNFSIISGCELVGTTVANGVVFINGEVLNFVGGEVQDKVIIVESIEALEFEDLNPRDVIYTRHATFGTAPVQWDWADFARGIPTKSLQLMFANINTSLGTIITKLNTIEENAKVQLQSDFAQTDATKKDFIKNKGSFTKILRSGTLNVGNPGGSSNTQVDFDALPNNSYQVIATLISLGSHGANAGSLTWIINDKQSNYFKFFIQENGNITQDVKLDWALIEITQPEIPL